MDSRLIFSEKNNRLILCDLSYRQNTWLIIAWYEGIMCDKHHIFSGCLTDQHPVKRILMRRAVSSNLDFSKRMVYNLSKSLIKSFNFSQTDATFWQSFLSR